MQLEKKDTAQEQSILRQEKKKSAKHFAHRQVPSQLWHALSNEMPEMHTYLKFCI
jgi:hypothetical protein